MSLRRGDSWRLGIISFVFCICLLSSFVFGLRINEVELNPAGKDTGNEWIELYSEDEINLEDYILKNNDGDEIRLSGKFSGYKVVMFEKQWLDNSDEKVFLIKGEETIDETDLFKDSSNNDKTWQYCNGKWEFKDSTQRKDNGCENTDEMDGEKENKAENIDEEEAEEGKEGEEKNESEKIEENKREKIENESEKEGDEGEEKIIKLNELGNIKSWGSKEYKSKAEYIKEYGIYGFALFCIFVIVLLIIKRF